MDLIFDCVNVKTTKLKNDGIGLPKYRVLLKDISKYDIRNNVELMLSLLDYDDLNDLKLIIDDII